LDYTGQLVAQNRVILQKTVEPLLKEGILSSNIPEHGCIYFPEISGLKDTSDFAQQLADRFKVLIVPGRFFDEPNHIRIGFGGNSEKLKISLERFVEGALKLKRQ
jgi:aspartate/methionine/tyrosine aminotransferase